jgi:Kef-type K+ transport system membrane component KefB
VEPIQLAAVLATAVLVASMASVELGVTVALIELTLGVVAGNVFDLQSQEWLDFIAAFASIVLTFLAGMEVDTDYMRDRAKATVGLGIASFAGPFPGGDARLLPRARLVGPRLADCRHGPLHDLACGRLRRSR